MVKITLRLDKRYRLKDGKYPIKMAVARNRKTLYVPVGLSVLEEDWGNTPPNYIKNLPQRKALNTFLGMQLSQAELTIQELQAKGELRILTDKELINILSPDKTKQERKDTSLFSIYAAQCIKEKKKKSTRDTYEATIKAMQGFCNYETLALQDIDKTWLENFSNYLKEQKKAPNSIVIYVSNVRAICKYAKDNGAKIEIPTKIHLHKEETKKRSLAIDDVRLLANGNFPQNIQPYVDIFLLILLMRGINVKDLSLLKADAIKRGRIEYSREKTGTHYSIKIEPEMLTIINRYKGKERLLKFFDRKKERYYKVFGYVLSERIRIAANSVGITEPLTSYYARHSWATFSVELGATIEMTSAGLGHKIGAQVTQVYVAFRQKQVDKLARRVIDYIYKKGEFAPID